ncbi:hypothetical protein Aperf_G00000128321 [Anoplocephala perfoliata]
MWHVTTAAVIVLTLFYVPVMSKDVLGRLYLSVEYSLVEGGQRDFLESRNLYFIICISKIGSTLCGIYSNITRVYPDANELRPATMNETEIPLSSPIGKGVKISIDICHFDNFESGDMMAQFRGTIDSKTLSMKWSRIPLNRTDRVYQNGIIFKSFVRMECQEEFCKAVCIPRKGINTCDDEGNMLCEKGKFPFDSNGLQGPGEGMHLLSGAACQKGYDPCQSNSPCESHGQCRTSGPYYECVCETGWGGNHCERPVTACESAAKRLSPEAVCLNGGSCVDSLNDSSYNCICLQPWSGSRCEVNDTCAEENCSGHGVCVFFGTSNKSLHCRCDAGWFGDSCNYQSQSPCYDANLNLHTNSSMVCLNGGICINGRNGVDFNCDCKFGWLGPQCETFFTETLYFILPMAAAPVLFFMAIAFCVRILWRSKHKVAPLTYVAMPRAENTDGDSAYSKIVPYAVYISSDWKDAKLNRKEVTKVFGKPTMSSINDWKSEEDIGLPLPPRDCLSEILTTNPRSVSQYSQFN